MEGSYTYTSSEGYDEFLGKRGIPWFIRKMILAAPVELQVTLHHCLNVMGYCCIETKDMKGDCETASAKSGHSVG